ncbi:hypothetical protein THASP1DRAFT_29737 [Thamnocephalis sphaerospora]|uniref:Uncharacterized protein n=1 Tax=Thamnocephalis sphaerospora TaxID=78915 RepID=A0A4P9XQX3_9FUNG|nr:hypothetical protein THASP1DRAFT_29737 [Thamnocephalis sphaerospora]|eukprot:RKP08456.1 hypothetical protein THASP1DRAFT_29737 [Thamnocephalis sphaerospora]
MGTLQTAERLEAILHRALTQIASGKCRDNSTDVWPLLAYELLRNDPPAEALESTHAEREEASHLRSLLSGDAATANSSSLAPFDMGNSLAAANDHPTTLSRATTSIDRLDVNEDVQERVRWIAEKAAEHGTLWLSRVHDDEAELTDAVCRFFYMANSPK